MLFLLNALNCNHYLKILSNSCTEHLLVWDTSIVELTSIVASLSLFASVFCDSGLGGGQAAEPFSRSIKSNPYIIISGKF